jgi:hypothetical protein
MKFCYSSDNVETYIFSNEMPFLTVTLSATPTVLTNNCKHELYAIIQVKYAHIISEYIFFSEIRRRAVFLKSLFRVYLIYSFTQYAVIIPL